MGTRVGEDWVKSGMSDDGAGYSMAMRHVDMR